MKKDVVAGSGAGISLIDENLLKSKVYTICGVKVMLDADLAEIYGYSVKTFNQQVKNNIHKFPDDFRFQLSKKEVENLSRSNFLTSIQVKGVKGGRSYLPYAFTEQGIYMLMTVLKGELAVQQSIAIIRLFKNMKDYIAAENQQLLESANCVQIAALTAQNSKDIADLRNESRETKESLGKVMEYFLDPSTYKHYAIMEGQRLLADVAYTRIYGYARETIFSDRF